MAGAVETLLEDILLFARGARRQALAADGVMYNPLNATMDAADYLNSCIPPSGVVSLASSACGVGKGMVPGSEVANRAAAAAAAVVQRMRGVVQQEEMDWDAAAHDPGCYTMVIYPRWAVAVDSLGTGHYMREP
jgi:hypothetical protein